jgi:SEC-C motif-containing protein
MAETDCPCCSGKPFARCCQPFLTGKAKPRTVKQLMRSRYSAYALGGFGEYLLATWVPRNRPKESAESLSLKTADWQGLTILDSSQQGDKGVVDFAARYLDARGQEQVHREQSVFLRHKGSWYYVDALHVQTGG